MHNYYKAGEWNVICDICGKKIKAGEAKHRWDGFIVCPSDFEYRHEQDFVRARQDKISVPFTRPRPVDIFTGVTSIRTYVEEDYIQDVQVIKTYFEEF